MEDSVNEVWKPTHVNPDYMVSNLGRIKVLDRYIWHTPNNAYSLRKGRVLNPTNKNTKKYWRIKIPSITGDKSSGKTYSVHRLVATAFIPNPNGFTQINHKDGNKDNNSVSNLEWCNQSHNLAHAYKMGLISREKESINCHLRKLTKQQVSYIKVEYAKTPLLKRGDKMRFCEKMREKFGLKSRNTIFWIIQGGTNKYIQ